MRRSRFNHSRNEQEQDFELNIASIIDAFTVLIAFMLASASFLSIGILDAEVAAAGATQTETASEPINVMIEVKENKGIRINVSGRVNRTHWIGANFGKEGEQVDLNAFSDRLALMKGEFAGVKSAVLMADPNVQYREVVQTMEVAKKAFPAVYLGGF